MRQAPDGIRAVAMEAVPDLVVHAAPPHVDQGLPGHLERLGYGAFPVPEQETDLVRRKSGERSRIRPLIDHSCPQLIVMPAPLPGMATRRR